MRIDEELDEGITKWFELVLDNIFSNDCFYIKKNLLTDLNFFDNNTVAIITTFAIVPNTNMVIVVDAAIMMPVLSNGRE